MNWISFQFLYKCVQHETQKQNCAFYFRKWPHLVMTLLITLLKSATSSTNLNQKFYKSFQIRIFQDCPSGTSTGSFSQPVSPTNLPGCFSTYLSLWSSYHQISCCYRVIGLSSNIFLLLSSYHQISCRQFPPCCARAFTHSSALLRSFTNANLLAKCFAGIFCCWNFKTNICTFCLTCSTTNKRFHLFYWTVALSHLQQYNFLSFELILLDQNISVARKQELQLWQSVKLTVSL